MSGEIGQWNEWNDTGEVEWNLLAFPMHQGIQNLVHDLNHFYRLNNALWENDFDYTGFGWIDFSDSKNSVISYLRKSSTEQILCIHNFTPQTWPEYFIRLPHLAVIREAFNTDHVRYGGSGKLDPQPRITADRSGAILQLAPLSTQIYHVHFA